MPSPSRRASSTTASFSATTLLRLLHLPRYARPHQVDELEDTEPVDEHTLPHRHTARLGYELFQAVDKVEDVQDASSSFSSASFSTLPPHARARNGPRLRQRAVAISRIRVPLMNRYSRLPMRKTGSISGAIFRFINAMSNLGVEIGCPPHAPNEYVRTLLTREVYSQSAEGYDRNVGAVADRLLEHNDPLLRAEQRRGGVGHADDYTVVERRGSACDVEVAVGDRIQSGRQKERSSHEPPRLLMVERERRIPVAPAQKPPRPASSSGHWRRFECSTASTPFGASSPRSIKEASST